MSRIGDANVPLESNGVPVSYPGINWCLHWPGRAPSTEPVGPRAPAHSSPTMPKEAYATHKEGLSTCLLILGPLARVKKLLNLHMATL